MNNNKKSNIKQILVLITLILIIILGIIITGNNNKNNTNQNVNDTAQESHTLDIIPPYSSSPYVVINNNIPNFKVEDFSTTSFENYSDLDNFGRCGVVFANLSKETMIKEDEKITWPCILNYLGRLISLRITFSSFFIGFVRNLL